MKRTIYKPNLARFNMVWVLLIIIFYLVGAANDKLYLIGPKFWTILVSIFVVLNLCLIAYRISVDENDTFLEERFFFWKRSIPLNELKNVRSLFAHFWDNYLAGNYIFENSKGQFTPPFPLIHVIPYAMYFSDVKFLPEILKNHPSIKVSKFVATYMQHPYLFTYFQYWNNPLTLRLLLIALILFMIAAVLFLIDGSLFMK